MKKIFKITAAILLLVVLAVTVAVWNYRFCSRYVSLPGLKLLFMGCYSRSGYAHLNKGEWDAAIADFTDAIRVDGESDVIDAIWAGRGMAYYDKHEWDKAIGDLTEAIKRNGNNTTTRHYRAEAYGEKKEWDKSISDCNEIIRLEPSHARGHGMRGRAHYYKGEYEQALDDFKEQTRLDPKNWVAFHALACILAACPTASIRDGDAAVKAATSACELKGWQDPDCIGALAGWKGALLFRWRRSVSLLTSGCWRRRFGSMECQRRRHNLLIRSRKLWALSVRMRTVIGALNTRRAAGRVATGC